MISAKFVGVYRDIKDGLYTLLRETVAEKPNKDAIMKAQDGLVTILVGQFTDENTEKIDDSKPVGETALARFLALSATIAFFDGFDNDRSLSDSELEFAFDGFGEMLKSCLELEGESTGNGDCDAQKMGSNILSNIRACSLQEYLSENLYEDDIALINKMCEPKTEELEDKELLDLILDDTMISGYVQDTLEAILAVYKVVFQDGFGLRPYYGVLSGNTGQAAYYVNDSDRLACDSKSNSFFTRVYENISKNFDVVVSGSRQFDYKLVLESGKPVYFPKKILEIALGRRLTSELSLDIYKPFENVNSYEEYEKQYVRPMMLAELQKVVYEVCKEKGITTLESLGTSQASRVIEDALGKVQRSYCTVLVISEFNNLGNKVNSVGLRMVNTTGRVNPSMTSELFSMRSVNKELVYTDALVLSDGQYINNDTSCPLPFEVFEFKHNFDSKLAQAEPLFGYTAVEMFKRRGIAVSWDNILIGESLAGTPLFCGYAEGCLPIQGNVSHNMMAGSRSGKGVMTMNLLSCALASNKAIFYLDRKPDMAVMFQELTGGNMFIVNGGQYEAANDPSKVLGETSDAVRGWDNPANMPDYVFKLLGSPRTYNGAFGDMVYWRAMMLCFSILVARVTFAADEGIYNKLGGSEGVVFVFDEFKNWQTMFEKKFLNSDGVFCNLNRLSKQDRAAFSKGFLDIANKTDEMNSDGIKEEKRRKLEREIAAKEAELTALITPEKVYCTQLMDKLEDTIRVCSEKTSAGFYGDANEEVNKIDLFVIGQHIEFSGLDGLYERRDSGLYNTNEHNKGRSIMRGLIDTFKHDWFMGYNQDGDSQKKYLGADKAGTKANKFVTGMQYWAYCNGASLESLRTTCPSNAVFFKPYLVLNNSLEDNPNEPMMVADADGKASSIPDPRYKFVSGCRERVNKAVPGLWETVRLKHVPNPDEQDVKKNGTPQYGTLNRGIGFEGLAEATMLTSESNLCFTDVLARSKDIADFVAQCMGYVDYKALLFDMSPNGLFSANDVVDAIANPEEYQRNLERRLPLFKEFGLLDGEPISRDLDADDSYYASENDDLDAYLEQNSEMNTNTSSPLAENEVHSSFTGNYANTEDSTSKASDYQSERERRRQEAFGTMGSSTQEPAKFDYSTVDDFIDNTHDELEDYRRAMMKEAERLYDLYSDRSTFMRELGKQRCCEIFLEEFMKERGYV